MYEDGELCAWECERDIIHLLRRNMVETSSMTVTDCSCPSSICLSIQVNVSDVHAGELYMLAGDPGQDRNIYSNSDHSVVMTKMASLPRVSKFFEFYSFSTNLLVYSFSDLRFLSRRWVCRWEWGFSSSTSQRGWRRVEGRRDDGNKTQQMDGQGRVQREDGWKLHLERENFSNISFNEMHTWFSIMWCSY